jgi:lipid A ethanolaminephosphotransferase
MNAIIRLVNRQTLTTNQLVFLTCCYIVFPLNIPFITKIASATLTLDEYSLWFLLSTPVLLLSISIAIQSIFSFRWVAKPFLILMVLTSSVVFYSTMTFGIVFDYGMIQNTVETDRAEAFSYINWPAILYIGLFGIVPSVLIIRTKLTYRNFMGELFSRLKLLAVSCVLVFVILLIFYSDYASIGRNNRDLSSYLTPYALLDSAAKYLVNNTLYPPLKFKLLDTRPTSIDNESKKQVTVLVLGETARSSNFSLNGYLRPTNNFTEKLDVVSFSQMTSCGTATAVSVPCMFSRLDRKNYNRREAIAQQNVIDIIHLAGVDVLWISNNNGGCKGVCSRVKTLQTRPLKSDPLCDGEYCFDEILVKQLKSKLANLSHTKTLIVLHMIGSHGPTYYKRYPDIARRFKPDCRKSDIQNCTHHELVNTYDNTIVYTDYVLSKVINELTLASGVEDIETSMIYVSDHGESLGENGVFLHGLPYVFAPKEQTSVPLIFWSDPSHQSSRMSCMRNISQSPISHDNIFDLLLGEMKISSKLYRYQKDLFKSCGNDRSHQRIVKNLKTGESND